MPTNIEGTIARLDFEMILIGHVDFWSASER